MKTTFIIFAALLTSVAQAQFKTDAAGFYVSGHTALSIDGLVIVPTNWVHLSSTSIEVSATPLPGSPGSIKRVYSITPALPIDGLTTIGLYYKPAELNGNSAFTLQMVYSETSGKPYVVTTGSTSEPADNFVYKNIAAAHALGKVTAMQSGGALPVRLAVFNVTKEGKTALLNWETVWEANSEEFQVEKSFDAKTWQHIGSVKSFGNTVERQFYTFKDENPVTAGSGNTAYYRLKQIDFDGSYAYSQIRSITLDAFPSIYAYPNPVTDRLFLSGDAASIGSLQIIGQNGRVLKEIAGTQLGDANYDGLDVKTLQAGTYLIKTSLISGETQRLKIVKK